MWHKGKILIIKPDKNVGRIFYQNEEISRNIKFDSCYEDNDKIEVKLNNSNDYDSVERIRFDRDVDYFGIIAYFNKDKKFGLIVCNYPKLKGGVTFHPQNFKKKFSSSQIETGLKVKFTLSLIKGDLQARNIKIVPKSNDSESYKCNSPNFYYLNGEVKLIKKDGGFGFIDKSTTDLKTEDNIFFHINNVININSIHKINRGDELYFTTQKSDKGIMAVNILKMRSQTFMNFANLEKNNIYFCYTSENEVKETYKFNINSTNQLIACYKYFLFKHLPLTKKLQMTNELLKRGLDIKKVRRENLLPEKEKLLLKLIRKNKNNKDIRYIYERELFKMTKNFANFSQKYDNYLEMNKDKVIEDYQGLNNSWQIEIPSENE